MRHFKYIILSLVLALLLVGGCNYYTTGQDIVTEPNVTEDNVTEGDIVEEIEDT